MRDASMWPRRPVCQRRVGLSSYTSPKILRAKGIGSKLRRRFQFEPVADAPPLEPDLTLSEVVASLEQAEHRDPLASLPRGWFHMPLKRKQLVAELLGTQTPERIVDLPGRPRHFPTGPRV